MSRIIFLPVPKSFKDQFKNKNEGFTIEPKIPIPIEIEEGSSENALSGLSMDMIVKGMLRAIETKQVKQEWIDYYSAFVLYIRPDILEICQEEQSIRQSES